MPRLVVLLLLSIVAGFAGADDVLYLYNWNNYISDATLQRFEASCRCRVRQDYYSDNEEMLAKLEAGATGYDILVPTGNAVESLIRRAALRPVDHSRLPNMGNIDPTFRDPWFDPGNRYSIPYATSVTLIGYNVEKMRQLGLPTDSWALIFEPQYLARLRGKVTVLNSQRELLAAGLAFLFPVGKQVDANHESNLRSASPQATNKAGASAAKFFGRILELRTIFANGLATSVSTWVRPATVSARPGMTAQPPASTM